MPMELHTKEGLNRALKHLENADPYKAHDELLALFYSDINNMELVFTGNYCNLWCEYLKTTLKIEDSFLKGEQLLIDWKNFISYIRRQSDIFEPALFALQKGIFSLALNCFLQVKEEKDSIHKAAVFRKIGVCYKQLGEYPNAFKSLSDANDLHPYQADILADLADCYALTGDDRSAKVLFREAFFIEPSKIELDFLNSSLIRDIIDELSEKNYPDSVLCCWIPVYAVLWGIFNVTRTLGSKDIAGIQKEIFALENENKNPSSNSEVIVPRLINLYFWLIDFYLKKNENTNQVDKLLLKIKILDSSIYEQYVK